MFLKKFSVLNFENSLTFKIKRFRIFDHFFKSVNYSNLENG